MPRRGREEEDDDYEDRPSTPPRQRMRVGAKREDELSISLFKMLHNPISIQNKQLWPWNHGKGSIIRLSIHNFVSNRGDFTIYPGPGLNLVLGPNGSGKSTIVDALCLGLGGSIKLLGVSEKLSSLVCRDSDGEDDQAWIETELASGNSRSPSRVIRRRIYRKSNNSDWWLDGRASSEKKVMEVVSSLNINVGNPCQFLPQFSNDIASRSPKLLLDFFQEDDNGRELQNQLVEMQGVGEEADKRVSTLTSRIETLRERQARLEADRMRYDRYIAVKADLNELKAYRPWLRFELSRRLFAALDDRFKGLKRRIEEEKKQFKPINDKMTEIRELGERIEKDKRTAEKACSKSMGDKKQVHRHLEDAYQKVIVAEDQLDSLHEEEKEKRDLHTKRVAQCRRTEEELAAARETQGSTDYTHVLNELTREKNKLVSDKKAKEREVNAAGGTLDVVRSRLRGLQQSDKRQQELFRLDRQDDRGNHSERALLQIVQPMKKRNEFKADVFGPIPLTVRLANSHAAAALEAAMPKYLFATFVVLNGDDREILSRRLKENRILVHNQMPQNIDMAKSPQRVVDIGRMSKYGVIGWLDEFVEAPLPVLKVLMDHASIHRIAVSNRNLSVQQVSEFCRDFVGVKLFTPKHEYMSMKSRRGGYVSNTTRVLHPSRVLHIPMGADSSEKERVVQEEKQISAKLQALRDAIGKIDDAVGRIDGKRRDLINRQRAVARLTTKLKSQQDLAREAEEELRSDAQMKKEEKRLGNMLNIRAMKYRDLLVNGSKTLDAESDHYIALQDIRMSWEAARAMLRHYKDLHERMMEQSSAIQEEYKAVETQRQHAKATSRQLRKAAIKEWDNAEPTDEDKNKWRNNPDNYPDDIDVLDGMIQTRERNVEALFPDPGIIQRYEERKKELEQEEKRLVDARTESDRIKKEISEAKERWIVPLRAKVTKVGAKFTQLMASIGFAGEITLIEHPKFSEYELEIRVRFRDGEELHALRAGRQSGGEKGISSFIFLMALQETVTAPFRLVDEIDHGMSVVNAIKAHQVVNDMAGDGKPQYWFVTPNVPKNLPIGSDAQVFVMAHGCGFRTSVSPTF